MKFFSLLLFPLFVGSISCSGAGEKPENNGIGELFPIDVSQTNFTIGSGGGSLYATLSSNRAVSVVSQRTWCQASIISDAAVDNLVITVEPNNGDERTAGILLSAAESPNVELTVTQAMYDDSGNGDNGDKNYLTFRASSYNVRVETPEDVAGGNGWAVRRLPLTNLIKWHDFDIVGTQEADVHQVADMQNLLSDYSHFANPYGAHNLATFYKKDKFEVLDRGVFWLSQTPDVESMGWDATSLRICHWALFKEKSTNIEFYFFNTHWYYQNITARQNSGPLVVQKIQEIAGNKPVILVGDMNSTPNTSQMIAIQSLLRDAFEITETPRNGPVDTTLAGGVFEGPLNGRIDYILVSPHFRVLDYSVLVDTHNNGRYPSDHLPVVSTLGIEIK